MARFFNNLLVRLYGNPPDRDHWMENNLETLARKAKIEDLNIYFAFGTADRYQDAFPMEEGIRKLDRVLEERGIEHVYRVYENEPHGWELVNLHLQEVLTFLTRTF